MPDRSVISRANRLLARVVADFVAGISQAIVVRAGAGAGKSGLVTEAAGRVVEARLRVAVTAPTNAQVADLVRRFARSFPKVGIVYLHATSYTPPDDILGLPNVIATSSPGEARGAHIVLATNDKFAHSADALVDGFDRLILDEAYQADSARYLCVAGLAPVHLLVGDAGQLDPFSTVDTTRWRGQAEDPLLTAIGVLLRNHPDIQPEAMPITRRLPPSAVPVVQPAFYGPQLDFRAATLPGERELRTTIAGHGRRTRLADAAIDHVVGFGWAHVELPDAAVLVSDPETADTIVAIVHRLIERGPESRCERQRRLAPLAAERLAVIVSHNEQVDLLRHQLDASGHQNVPVSTANKMQGLEFDVTVVWHPLAGLPDLDEFHLDPGRLCVMLTRHRHGCILVGRASDREHVAHQPPTTPAYLGWDPDPVLDGWEAHRQIFEGLEPHVVAA